MKLIFKSAPPIDWNINDGTPSEDLVRDLEYILVQTEHEYDFIHTIYNNIPSCNGPVENITYHGDMAKFIVDNL